MSTPVAGVVTSLATARRAIQLYPAGHSAYTAALDALVGSIRGASNGEPLVLNWHQGRLYRASTVIPDDVSGGRAIAEAFEARGIESLTFLDAFCTTDAVGLVEVLSLKPGPDFDVEAELTTRAVTAVVASVLVDSDSEERAERDRVRAADRAMYNRVITTLRRVNETFVTGGTTDLGETTSLIGDIMERLLADPGAMMGLATIRGTNERTLYHSLNVAIYSLVMGQKLGLPDEGLASLGMCALLHDMGKAAFDPNDPQQVEPMRVMHPEVGAHILERVALEDPAPMLVAYEHHMCPDGSGWPERPADYMPHPFSRMVAVADRYHNLTDAEAGGTSLTPDRAIVQLMREAGTILDAFYVRLLSGLLGVFPVGCIVRLSDLSVGVVCRPGEDPLSPTVRMTYDERGNEIAEHVEIDLRQSPLHIVEVVSPESLDIRVADKL